MGLVPFWLNDLASLDSGSAHAPSLHSPLQSSSAVRCSPFKKIISVNLYNMIFKALLPLSLESEAIQSLRCLRSSLKRCCCSMNLPEKNTDEEEYEILRMPITKDARPYGLTDTDA